MTRPIASRWSASSPQPLSAPSICALVAHVLLLYTCVGPAHAQPSSPNYSNTEIILKMRPGKGFLHAPPGAIRSHSSSLDDRLIRAAALEAVPVFPAEGADPQLRATLGMDRFYLVRLGRPADVPAMAAELSRHPDVELAEPNHGGTGLGVVAGQSVFPNDTYFDRQWGFRNTGSNSGGFPAVAGADIKATDAWSISTGDSSVIVAVLDSGLKYDHPDIAGRVWTNQGEIPSNQLDDDGNGFIDDVRGWNFVDWSNEVRDDNGHGTNVSSILGATANNGLGYAGLDWTCKIMPLKVLNASNFGYYAWWAHALYYAANNGARVVNMSLGGTDPSPTLEVAIRYAHGRGCFIAASMGNAGTALPEFIPAAYRAEVVAVGATEPRDRRTSFSSYGNHIDVVAPGLFIYGLSHSSDSDYNRAFSGTSMAAPMVAGLAALLLAKDASLSPDAIRDIIRATADDGVGDPSEDTPGFDVYHGFGRINCYRALALDHVPHAPVVTAPSEVSGDEGTLISIHVSAVDPDGDPIQTLTADLGSLPPGHNAAFSPNADNSAGVLTWTPTGNDAGNYSVTFTASDVLPASATTRIAIANTNQAPTITAPAALSVQEHVTLQFEVRATDPDFDDLTLDAAGVPPGARFIYNFDNSATFLWLPSSGQAGSYLVLFGVTDGHGGSTTASTQIEVTPNRPPTVTAPDGVEGHEGVLLSFEVTAADPDGEAVASLLADLSGLPLGHGAAFVVQDEGTRGTFSWTPGFGHAGGYPVVFTGSNAAAGRATTYLTIQDVDRPPAVTAPSAVAGAENALIAVAVTAADPDGEAIQSLTAAPLPAGATFEVGVGNSSGFLRWTPDFTQAGAYAITIAARSAPRAQPVSAPLVEGSATMMLEIANIDRAPIADAGGPYSGVSASPVEFDGRDSSDPDGDALTYAWDFGDGGSGSGPTPVHTYTAEGTFDVALRVTDPGGLHGDAATTATVRAEIAVVVMLKSNGTTLDAKKGKGHSKFAIEQTERPYSSILANTLQLTTGFPNSGTVPSCPAELKAGTGTIGDMNLNGIPDYQISFAGSCVKNLFSNVPDNSTVNIIILGQFATSTGMSSLRGMKTVTVRTGGAAAPISASAYPNPFNPQTSISYTVKSAGLVTLRIYSIDGRLVRTLIRAEATAPGTHEVSWNGTDDQGRRVSSGIYLVKTSRIAGITEESSGFKLVVTK